jgi:hypothetical protein
MSTPLDITCSKCGRRIGVLVSPPRDHLEPLNLEFSCPECFDQVVRSKAITLQSETSWGKLQAELKGRI